MAESQAEGTNPFFLFCQHFLLYATSLFSQLASDNFLRSVSDDDILQFVFKFFNEKRNFSTVFFECNTQKYFSLKVETINRRARKAYLYPMIMQKNRYTNPNYTFLDKQFPLCSEYLFAICVHFSQPVTLHCTKIRTYWPYESS